MTGFKKNLSLFSASMALALTLTVSPSFAQDTAAPAATDAVPEQAQSPATEEELVVTGSRIRRDEYTSVSPVQIVTSESATLEGLVDTAEIVQTASVASGSVQINNQFGGFVVEGGTGVNTVSLRGLGAQRSLILLNGRRPGPAGVRGQVGAFDLNVIPSSVVQRFEILKDGASSIYGSDAVAGVVNVITLDRVDRPTIDLDIQQPFDSGGESWSIDAATGFNFDRGNIVLAAEYQQRGDLKAGDRDYLRCAEDLIYDPTTGARIDLEDRSILAGTEYAGCNNIFHNTLLDLVFTGEFYVPSTDGSTVGPITGYRPETINRYDDADPDVGYYDAVLNDPRYLSSDVLAAQERLSLFASSNFNLDMLGGVDWKNELLFTHRRTEVDGWRQFFPLIGGEVSCFFFGLCYDNDPLYDHPFYVARPVVLWQSDSWAEVDYLSFASQLEGAFGNGWSWNLYGTFSRSDGEYGGNSIIASASGDVEFDEDAPIYDPYDPEFLSGNYGDDVYEALTHNSRGSTVYEQTVLNGFVTGELFSLPAGVVEGAFGFEYRNYSIEDRPDPLAQAGDLWGETSADPTIGDDTVKELFAELDIPVLRGQSLFEDFTINLSTRVFDYDSYGSDSVWRAGFNWQVTPTFRLRGTQGTSYRAPALYELFLGNQTGFQSNFDIDPCIRWGLSTNDNIRDNCAAEGIPDDFDGDAQSALTLTAGGAGNLDAETSEATTFGFVYTPTFIDLSLAIDYFKIEVNNQITQFGSAAILAACYGGENFPNEFCLLFDRNSGADPSRPFAITEVRDNYVNINSQETDGIDLTLRYEHELDIGNLLFEGQATWTFTDVVQVFEPGTVSGFDDNDFNSTIGDPDFVANTRLSFERGDWTISWFTNFVGRTSQQRFADREVTYSGRPGTRKNFTEAVVYHDGSVRWEGDDVTVILGVSNIFNEAPPTVGAGVTARAGNAPLFGTQYDLIGRAAFLSLSRSF